ncbi:hypothetical protein DBR10_00980, partial [Caulobacter sp. HMWF025]
MTGGSGGAGGAGAQGYRDGKDGDAGAAGSAWGSGIYLQGTQNITFSPGLGQTQIIAGAIDDAAGQHAGSGVGSVSMKGDGLLILSAANSFTGGLKLYGGTTELAAAGAAGLAGTGSFAKIDFVGVAALKVDSAALVSTGVVSTSGSVSYSFGGELVNFAGGDSVIFSSLSAAGASYTYVPGNHILAIHSGGKDVVLRLSGFSAESFTLSANSSGNLVITGAMATVNDLNAAIVNANAMPANSGVIHINLTSNIYLSNNALQAINLKPGVTLNIDGGNYVIDGQSKQRGLFVYSGEVTIENLTIQNMVAKGGAGSGAGAGLGGGLFVANDSAHGAAPGVVTLTNVNFAGNSAIGGSATAGMNQGGGGGMGGDGGNGSDFYGAG